MNANKRWINMATEWNNALSDYLIAVLNYTKEVNHISEDKSNIRKNLEIAEKKAREKKNIYFNLLNDKKN